MAGKYVNPGEDYNRDQRYITTRITQDGRDGYPVESGRYQLIVSRACPWANRAIIVRRLLGLEDAISMGVAGPTHDERSPKPPKPPKPAEIVPAAHTPLAA